MKNKKVRKIIIIFAIILVLVIISIKPCYLFKRIRYKIDQQKETVTTKIEIKEGYIYNDSFAVGSYYYFDGDNCIVNDDEWDNDICTIDVTNLSETGYITVTGSIVDSFDDTIVIFNNNSISSFTEEAIDTDWVFKTPYITKEISIVLDLEKMNLNSNNKLQIIAGNISKTIEIYFKK